VFVFVENSKSDFVAGPPSANFYIISKKKISKKLEILFCSYKCYCRPFALQFKKRHDCRKESLPIILI